MMKIKKGFFILLFIIIFGTRFHYYDSIMVKAKEIEITIEPDNQKSKIEEQQFINQYAIIVNSMTNYEKELICKVAFLEAGNQEIEGQRAVIEVILNRIINPNYPNKVEEVLSEPRQFSTWKNISKVSKDQMEQMNNILNLVITSNDTILPNNNYLYFNNKENKNSIKIQDHWFWE